MNRHPTLAQLRRAHPFAFSDLARQAAVSQEVVYRMLLDAPVQRPQAEQVLAALSRRTGIPWTLEQVRVILEQEPGSEARSPVQNQGRWLPPDWQLETAPSSQVPIVLGGPIRGMRSLLSPPFRPEISEALIVLLKQHGGAVHVDTPLWHIAFPDGTTRQEVFPRSLSVRYLITFPNGFTLSETVSCISGQSILGVGEEDRVDASEPLPDRFCSKGTEQ